MQDLLRKQLDEFVRKYGTTNVFIAKSIGVSRGYISNFRKSQRNFSSEKAEKLTEFIKRTK